MTVLEPLLQPYICVSDAPRAIELYKEVFGMQERYRLPMGNKIGHAELERQGVRLLVSSEFEEVGVVGPKSLGGTTVSLLLYVEDVDDVARRAKECGFTQEGETTDQFFGDRTARLVDPFGHRWFVHQRLESLAPEEIVARFQREMGPS